MKKKKFLVGLVGEQKRREGDVAGEYKKKGGRKKELAKKKKQKEERKRVQSLGVVSLKESFLLCN